MAMDETMTLEDTVADAVTCKNCGKPVKRCTAFCNYGGWFHPHRLNEIRQLGDRVQQKPAGHPDRLGQANVLAAHYCAGADGPKAETLRDSGE